MYLDWSSHLVFLIPLSCQVSESTCHMSWLPCEPSVNNSRLSQMHKEMFMLRRRKFLQLISMIRLVRYVHYYSSFESTLYTCTPTTQGSLLKPYSWCFFLQISDLFSVCLYWYKAILVSKQYFFLCYCIFVWIVLFVIFHSFTNFFDIWRKILATIINECTFCAFIMILYDHVFCMYWAIHTWEGSRWSSTLLLLILFHWKLAGPVTGNKITTWLW